MCKKIWRMALGCAVAVAQVSCTSVLYIESTRPAEVAIADTQWKVAALNRYNPELLSFRKEKKVKVFEDGAREAFNGALAGILEDDTYDLVFTDTAAYKTTTVNSSLRPEQVQELHNRHPHHLLLSLEHFDTYLSKNTVNVEEEDGTVSKTAHYTLAAASTWALYDSTGHLLDRFILAEEMPYQSRAVLISFLAIGPALANAGASVQELGWYTGNRYWSRLAPQPVTLARSYYSTKDFHPAAGAMAAGDWQQAISLLEPLTGSSKRKEAARASYNLAIVYEAMGDVEQARYWAREAAKRKERLAAFLLSELERY